MRPKRRKLIELVNKGKIKGIISYSPDRQSRNLLEGGELVHLADNGLVDLKYTNFYFENTASGRMMLGIWFVTSAQYSDKLSEDVKRGLTSRSEKGKSFGVYKYGYIIEFDENTGLYNGYHKPHPQYFDMMRKAFEMKLYDKRSDDYIINKLIEMGYKKDHRGEETEVKNSKNRYEIWLDPFYYGVFQYGDRKTDIREVNPFFKPIISEEEHSILIQRHYGEVDYQSLKTIKDEHYDIMPFDEGFIKTEDGAVMTFNLPNKNRFYKKLAKERLTNPKITLGDIVKPNQIRYTNCNSKSEFHKLEITFDKIEEAICSLFDTIKMTDEEYTMYVEQGKIKLDNLLFTSSQERNLLNLQYGKIGKIKNEFIKTNLGKERNKDEDTVYWTELNKYNETLEKIEIKLGNLNTSERNQAYEIELFIDTLRKASSYYRKAKYVQKRKIASIFLSHIVITKERQVRVLPLGGLENLFQVIQGASDKFGTYLKLVEESSLYLKNLPLQSIIPIINFYRSNFIKEDNEFLSKFNEKQKVLYELDI